MRILLIKTDKFFLLRKSREAEVNIGLRLWMRY